MSDTSAGHRLQIPPLVVIDEEHLAAIVAPPHNVIGTPKPALNLQLVIGDVTPIPS